jgi:hypothetical protein
VIRVRKGLYVPGSRRGEEPPVDPLVLSGLVYGPAYVSLETALMKHGLIPERVEEITCITSKRAKQFDTPVGRFRYEPVNERAFGIGIRLEQTRGGSYFLAEPEKALCDRLAMISGLSSARDLLATLEDDLRVDFEEIVSTFRLPLVAEIAAAIRRSSVSAFHRRQAARHPVPQLEDPREGARLLRFHLVSRQSRALPSCASPEPHGANRPLDPRHDA